MSKCLCLTFRFLSPLYHGRRDGGLPEWPPSPLRAMQALVAAAARRDGPGFSTEAFEWLEQLRDPDVLAPRERPATSYRLSVPNNEGDKLAAAWVRGSEGNAAEQRAMKTVLPTRLLDGDAVHFVWRMADDAMSMQHASWLCALAGAVVVLGWGIDHVVGHGAVLDEGEAASLTGQRWLPRQAGVGGLRVPTRGSFADLCARHDSVLQRIGLGDEPYRPPKPLRCFRVVRYERAATTKGPSATVFRLMDLEGGRMRAFDTGRWTTKIAGMMRHAARRAAEKSGWAESAIRGVVLGHGEAQAPAPAHRLAFLPLPTIEGRPLGGVVVGDVRRIAVASFADGPAVDWASEALPGTGLVEEGTGREVAVMAPCLHDDPVATRFLGSHHSWVTVTPVVLPGHPDNGGLRRKLARTRDAKRQGELLARLDARVEGLLRKALVQAGLPAELASAAELDWSHVGFVAGVGRARDFAVPSHLVQSLRLHVRVRFCDQAGQPTSIRGPLCIGSGRFYGIGLFVSLVDP
jgi:CRISPR-associated protein Csb2